ncbi:MAG TPA: hypothetical protein VEP46_04420 [Vicinamibacterales bacterium]|nr:hypothetical protein [Vicinamibacterales bacterium]
MRRETNGQQSHDQRPNAYQCRHHHSVHVRPPGFSITLTASAVKLIPTLTAVSHASSGRSSTTRSSIGKTAHRTLNSKNHVEYTSRRASFLFMRLMGANGMPCDFRPESPRRQPDCCCSCELDLSALWQNLRVSSSIEGDGDVRDKDDGDPVFGDRLPADGRCGVGRIV